MEEGRKRFGLGKDVAATIIIDRVGSGLKNQDPALLRVLIPCFTQHYPGVIGRIVVAPVNNVVRTRHSSRMPSLASMQAECLSTSSHPNAISSHGLDIVLAVSNRR